MPDFRRERHRSVAKVLQDISPGFMDSAECYFGGGTRIVLELGEYRESADVDFLCASNHGYRKLRSSVTNTSLGGMFVNPPKLLRDVRADMYGIRTYLEVDGAPLKLEVVLEARIALAEMTVEPLSVPCLDHVSCIAEKFLANADRGLDKATRSRDLVDLAFMAASWTRGEFDAGLDLAVAAYGESVQRTLELSLELFAERSYRDLCTSELDVSEPRQLTSGLRKLRRYAEPT